MDDPLEEIYWRDELLQILYWLRGESLGDMITASELVRFLEAEAELVQRHLDRLAAHGYVERRDGTPTRYRLTAWGIQEGGRRFADEFSGLTGQGHGACSDPNCSCQTQGPEACEAHRGDA